MLFKKSLYIGNITRKKRRPPLKTFVEPNLVSCPQGTFLRTFWKRYRERKNAVTRMGDVLMTSKIDVFYHSKAKIQVPCTPKPSSISKTTVPIVKNSRQLDRSCYFVDKNAV